MNAAKLFQEILDGQYRPDPLKPTTPSDKLFWAMVHIPNELKSWVYELAKQHQLGINEVRVLVYMARISQEVGHPYFWTEGTDSKLLVNAAWKLEERGLLTRDESNKTFLYLAQQNPSNPPANRGNSPMEPLNPEQVRTLPTVELCDLFEETSDRTLTPEIANLRGLIINELSRRNKEKFDLWMNCSNPVLREKPIAFFTKIPHPYMP